MSHAEKCPVCNGIGRTETTETDTSTLVRKSQPCHGCAGKGWVEVGSDMTFVPVYPIPVPIPEPNPWHPCRWPLTTYIGTPHTPGRAVGGL